MLSDNKMMECDKRDLNSALGLQFDPHENLGQSSDMKDGGEMIPGSKKRSNSVEVGFNSEGDETIGSMFKLKSKRNPKKVKLGLGFGGDKGGQVEIRAEKMLVIDEDLGDLNDTLAIFRKKLKGSKIGSGFVSEPVRDFIMNSEEPHFDSLNGAVKEAADSVSNMENKRKGKSKRTKKTAQVDAYERTVVEETEKRRKQKNRKSKIASLQKKIDAKTEFNDVDLAAKSAQKEEMGDYNDSEETVVEVYVQKFKGKTKKYRAVNLLENNGNGIASADASGSADDGHTDQGDSDHYLNDNIEDSLSSFYRKAKSRGSSSSKELKKIPPAPEPVTIFSVSDDSLHQVSNCTQENTCQGDPRISNEIPRTNDNVDGPLNQDSHSHLVECSNKTPRPQKVELNLLHSISEEYTFVKVEKPSSFPRQAENISSINRSNDSTNNVLNESNLTLVQKITKQLPCENSEPLVCSEKIKPGDEMEFNSGLQKIINHKLTSADCNKLSACAQYSEIASTSSEKEDASASDSELFPVSPNQYHISFRPKEKPLETDEKQNPNAHDPPSDGSQHPKTSVDTCAFSQNPSSCSNEEGISSPSTTAGLTGSYADDTLSNHDPDSRQTKLLSAGQRVLRRLKKHRHRDMAYEGDADWDVLTYEQDFLISSQLGDEGQTIRRDKKQNLLSVMADSGGAAAVSSGLKACAVGIVEEIKFKEVLKRKGGLQEYLEYRNHILGRWSKDMSRILPISEFGVSASPSADESRCASLIRDIYRFLDHYGYINFGVASTKETVDTGAEHKVEVAEEKKAVAPHVDSDDAVSFALGSANQKDDSIMDEEDKIKHLQNLELSHPTVPEPFPIEPYEQKVLIDTKPATCEERQRGSQCNEGNDPMDCDTLAKKRVIVIGAGPAGLTAARHLQHQGFSVMILEARSRIGGRVFTDRSSLSVPVDLGASIITGVEADVATERRPDPSSLVCAQLGLELTVLNSDCPLYDIVTGEKVPPNLDKSLEDEYNSLLDDTLVLVAQKGEEQAMRLSLEDGLEYALKKRRSVRPERRHGDNSKDEILSPLERRVMDWHFANLEYGCAALLKQVSLPHWNQDDVFGGFGGAHCMIKGGYSNVVESLAQGLAIHLNHVVTDVSYSNSDGKGVRVSTSNGQDFSADAVLITVPLGCLKKAKGIKFSPSLPLWKSSAIQRLGFGVLNKVAMEFPKVFWDETVDYFGATAEETEKRGQCFMFWNVKKTVGAPVLIALLVGKAAIDGQDMCSSNHVNHAVEVLRKLFGGSNVPDPVASVVTDWGRDPYSYGAYSYVSVGATGEDYDILGKPVDNCLFFAGEATCKEHPDTVGGAMMSGLREAVRIIDILSTGIDFTAQVEKVEAAALRHSYGEKNEVRDIINRLEAVELSDAIYNSFDRTRQNLLKDLFANAKTVAGRLHLVKELLTLPVNILKSFAGTKHGLSILNSWILDSLGKDGTQLLRHCVRLLVLVSTDLLAVRLSGIGKTVKEKVCVHTSRDIRAIASQLVSVWIEVFRKEKASNGGLKLLRQSAALDSFKTKSTSSSGKPPLRTAVLDKKGNSKIAAGPHNVRKIRPAKPDSRIYSKSEAKPSISQGSVERQDSKWEEDVDIMSEEEKTALAAAEAARAAELAAAEAYASSSARYNTLLQLPKIPSFHKFARREQYAQMDETEFRKKWSGGISGRQDCLSEIDSRNCRVRDWSVDFTAAGVNVDNHSNEIPSSQMNFLEHSGESVAADRCLLTKAWVDSAGSEGIKDNSAIDRWQSQAAAAADSDYFNQGVRGDEEGSDMGSNPATTWKPNESSASASASQVTINRELAHRSQPRGIEHIKQAVVDYVASLLMPLYKARKIDRDGYKSIMKKTAAKVIENTNDVEKVMVAFEFLDYKRKNKIRAFVDTLIERHMSQKRAAKS